MKHILLSCLCLSLIHADKAFATTGIIGGRNGTAAYAAFVDESGNLTTLDLGVPNGYIGAGGFNPNVAINTSGIGLIGGINGGNGYAAFVGPGSSVSPLSLSLSTGQIYSVAINDGGLGLIGGGGYKWRRNSCVCGNSRSGK